jgi:hypothetical protein
MAKRSKRQAASAQKNQPASPLLARKQLEAYLMSRELLRRMQRTSALYCGITPSIEETTRRLH